MIKNEKRIIEEIKRRIQYHIPIRYVYEDQVDIKLRPYVTKQGIRAPAVIGLSGGADSTLIACLCAEALGPENVIGVSMPYSELDNNTFNDRSRRLAEKLGIKHIVLPITRATDEINLSLQIAAIGVQEDVRDTKAISALNQGNTRSRVRMACLYGVAHHCGGRVVGTGNLSEDFIGYDTKGGDALADFFPIGDLFKSEVYQLLDYFVKEGKITEDLVDRVPSAGLWEGQTDEGELGYTYDQMEPAIKEIKKESIILEDTHNPVFHFVKKRHEENKHKHETPHVFQLREKYCI